MSPSEMEDLLEKLEEAQKEIGLSGPLLEEAISILESKIAVQNWACGN